MLVPRMTVLGEISPVRGFGVLLLLSAALPLHGQSERRYVGAEACANCHTDITHKWAQSFHSKMMQPATPQSVKGDFAQGEVMLRGSTYLLE
jgi:hypothetical protein